MKSKKSDLLGSFYLTWNQDPYRPKRMQGFLPAPGLFATHPLLLVTFSCSVFRSLALFATSHWAFCSILICRCFRSHLGTESLQPHSIQWFLDHVARSGVSPFWDNTPIDCFIYICMSNEISQSYLQSSPVCFSNTFHSNILANHYDHQKPHGKQKYSILIILHYIFDIPLPFGKLT